MPLPVELLRAVWCTLVTAELRYWLYWLNNVAVTCVPWSVCYVGLSLLEMCPGYSNIRKSDLIGEETSRFDSRSTLAIYYLKSMSMVWTWLFAITKYAAWSVELFEQLLISHMKIGGRIKSRSNWYWFEIIKPPWDVSDDQMQFIYFEMLGV